MTYDGSVQQLEAMGFSVQVAQYALNKTSGNLERAIDWVFSDEGMKFAENPVAPTEGDHRPQATDPALEAALRSSAAEIVHQPASDYSSGVRNIAGFSTHDGATVSHNEVIDLTDDKSSEDKEVEAAIALSLGRDTSSSSTTYGPSNKVEDGSTALVPTTGGATPTVADSDADLDRAIQDSLMTASFHSMSAVPAPAPSNHERDLASGTPIIMRASDSGATYAAHVLQALFAVPHFRDVIRLLPLNDDSDAGIRALQETIIEADSSPMAYYDVGGVTAALRKGREPYQLPPLEPAKGLWEAVTNAFSDTIPTVAERLTAMILPDASEPTQRRLRNPHKLVSTHVASLKGPVTYVNIHRSQEVSSIPAGLAKIMWIDGQEMDTVKELADVLVFIVQPGSRAPWQMEEVIYMDRFMKENVARSAQLRAEQGLAMGNVRRLRDKLQALTVHKEHKILDSLQRAMKHYDDSPESADMIYKETTRELRLKLNEIHDTLKTKVTELEAELAVEEHKAAGGLFETTDPAYLKHSFRLHAALWHDGFPTGLGHLYTYIRSDSGAWWKVTEHEATLIDFASVAGDRVGLYTDGGPYMLVYAREGDWPLTPARSPEDVAVQLPVHSEEQSQQAEVEAAPAPPAAAGDIEMADGEGSTPPLISMEPVDAETEQDASHQGIS